MVRCLERVSVRLSTDSLSAAIRQARKARQVTLVELARLIQVSYSTLARLETGGIPDPHPSLLYKISQGLHIDYMALMGLAGYAQPRSDGVTVPCVAASLSQWPYPTHADCWADVMASQNRVSYPVQHAMWALLLTEPCPDGGLQAGDTIWMGHDWQLGPRALVVDSPRAYLATRVATAASPIWLLGQTPMAPHMVPMGRVLGITYADSPAGLT